MIILISNIVKDILLQQIFSIVKDWRNGMKCLIIAAGMGSRFENKYYRTLLKSVLQMPLIESIILPAIEAEIKDFNVVTG